MPRLSLLSLTVLPLLAACGEAGGTFDDVQAIAAAKVEVCHFNNGAHEYTLIDVSESAVDTHLAHGDTLFADDQDCDGQPDIDWTCDAVSMDELDALLDRVAAETATYGDFRVTVHLQNLDQTLDDCYWNGYPDSRYTGYARYYDAYMTASAGNPRSGSYASYALGVRAWDRDFTITYAGGTSTYDDFGTYYFDEGTSSGGSYYNTVLDYDTVPPDFSDCVTDLATWAELRGVAVYENTGRYICE